MATSFKQGAKNLPRLENFTCQNGFVIFPLILFIHHIPKNDMTQSTRPCNLGTVVGPGKVENATHFPFF